MFYTMFYHISKLEVLTWRDRFVSTVAYDSIWICTLHGVLVEQLRISTLMQKVSKFCVLIATIKVLRTI